MPGSLQNKLQQFEVAPPLTVWDKISRQLDEEFNAADSRLSSQLDDASIIPPAGVWDTINAQLNNEIPAENQSRKVIPLLVRIAIAAAVIGVMFIGGLYFLNNDQRDNNVVKNIPRAVTPPPAASKPDQPELSDSSDHALVRNEKPAQAFKKVINRSAPRSPAAPDEAEPAGQIADLTVNPEQAPLYDLQTVSALQPVSVTAPPLRDKKGNIILDASLIGKPDDEYITVTGPNGKQTKISSKFLGCLSYINATLTSNDSDERAIQCKTQFEEWREKILSQPEFIPTANNFFDIFELKDLIQEM